MEYTSDILAIKKALKQTYKLSFVIIASFVLIGFVVAYFSSYKWNAEKIIYKLDSSYQNKLETLFFTLEGSHFNNDKLIEAYVKFFNSKRTQSDFESIYKLSNVGFYSTAIKVNNEYVLKALSVNKDEAEKGLNSYIEYTKMAFIKKNVNYLNRIRITLIDEYQNKLRNERKKASIEKNKRVEELKVALYISEKAGYEKPIKNLDLNSLSDPVFSNVIMGSNILKETIKSIEKSDLTLYSDKIARYQYITDEISNIKIDGNYINIFKNKGGITYKINGINKGNIILLFFFIGLILSTFSIVFRCKVER